MSTNTHRPHRRFFALAGASLLLATMLSIAVATPANARSFTECNTGPSTSIEGRTMNHTNFALTRVFLLKSPITSWAKEPAVTIGDKGQNDGLDDWCVYAPVFGTFLNVEYQIKSDGTKVSFFAERLLSGTGDSRCEVVGPSAASFSCRTHLENRLNPRVDATFSLFDKGQNG